MSIFRDFFVKEKPVFTGITRGIGGFGFGGKKLGKFRVSSGSFSTFIADGYTYYVVTSPTTIVFDGPGIISNLLIVAGGGGSAADRTGGGGAGGLRNLSNISVSAGQNPIIVGTGGPGALVDGGPSSAFGQSATGGGGGSGSPGSPGRPGGSGGGGPGRNSGGPGGTGNAGGYSPPEGNNGGPSSSEAIGGGGGGAGGSGSGSPSSYPGPGVTGGPGVLVPWVPTSYGENGYFAGGGASGPYGTATIVPAAPGGGGSNQRSAIPGTGGGGGGNPAAGAPGIIIFRLIPEE